MRLVFIDSELEEMARDPKFRSKDRHPDLVRAYRKKIGLLAAAPNQQSLAALRGLKLEKLRGSRAGQYSMRVNRQWRLIARFESDPSGRSIVVIELIDYH